jgi:hypothetical protein
MLSKKVQFLKPTCFVVELEVGVYQCGFVVFNL